MKRYLEFIKENVIEKEITIKSEEDFHLIKEGVKIIDASSAKLNSLPELPGSLEMLFCGNNKLNSLPELPENLRILHIIYNNFTSLPKLPESLKELKCYDNPLDYPIPHKFYFNQNKEWLEELNIKLSSYNHQKQLIEKNGVYIMKKYEHHTELINEKIKEENPTYFLSVEYGF
jgi:hypothetical protein